MKVVVTQEDINKGLPKKTKDCPVAQAMSRAFNVEIAVGKTATENYVYEKNESVGMWHDLNPRISAIIEKYDLTGHMEPFEFEVDDVI